MAHRNFSWIIVGLLAFSSVLAGCKKTDETKKPEKPQKPAPSKPVKGDETPDKKKPPVKTDPSAIDNMSTKDKAQKLIDGGVAFLVKNVQKDGSWKIMGSYEPAATGLVLKALLNSGKYDVNSPIIKKGFEAMLKYQQKDGSVYMPRRGRPNYCTAIAICAMAAAGDKYKPQMEKAVQYMRSIQILPNTKSRDVKGKKAGEIIPENHPFFGGVSYGKHGRPDLNNLGWWMQAMHEAGVKGDDKAMQNALHFVTRCQNYSETNKMPWVKEKGTNDGGMIYAPARRDTTKAESKVISKENKNAYLSYGSISYVGLKSMLYANVGKNDKRVKALYAWIARNWSVDTNPGMELTKKGGAGQTMGQYFYLNAMATALAAYGEPTIRVKGKDIDWRKALVDKLAELVREDGSWFNPNPRWYENDKILVTCYEVLALEEAMKTMK